jgi:hypothetical protein
MPHPPLMARMVLEKTVEHQKIISKSSNIIVYGISEELGDGDVRQLFGGDRDLPSLISNIVETYRLGHFKANAARPRPTLVKFNSTRARNEAFKHSKRLRWRSLSLAEDLTPSQQEARRHLLPKFQVFKAQGYPVLWRGATLCFRQANGRVHLWVPGEPPPGPPPARAYQEPRTAQARPPSRAASTTNTTAHVVQPPNREPRGTTTPMRDPCNEIQPAPLSDPSWKTIVKGRARTMATEPPQKSSAMIRENVRNAALQTTNPNAPRARTAAANAGESLGVRHQQTPGGRTASAIAGRAPGVQAIQPHGANEITLEGAAEDMDWIPPHQRVPPRHVPGATSGKRIAIQGEEEDPRAYDPGPPSDPLHTRGR